MILEWKLKNIQASTKISGTNSKGVKGGTFTKSVL